MFTIDKPRLGIFIYMVNSSNESSTLSPIIALFNTADPRNIDSDLARIYTVFQKRATKLMVVTSSNLNRFANFFHYCKEEEISNKNLILLPTTP